MSMLIAKIYNISLCMGGTCACKREKSSRHRSWCSFAPSKPPEWTCFLKINKSTTIASDWSVFHPIFASDCRSDPAPDPVCLDGLYVDGGPSSCTVSPGWLR